MFLKLTPSASGRSTTSSFRLWEPATSPAFASMACQSALLTEISPQPYLCQVFLLSPCQKQIYIYLSDQTSACMKSSARSAPTLHSGKLYGFTSFDMSAGDTDDDDGKHTRPTTMSSNDDIYTKLRPLTKYRFARIACPIVHTSAYSRQAQIPVNLASLRC